jgi:hypothetical protein
VWRLLWWWWWRRWGRRENVVEMMEMNDILFSMF